MFFTEIVSTHGSSIQELAQAAELFSIKMNPSSQTLKTTFSDVLNAQNIIIN